jgi:hypothetical protein
MKDFVKNNIELFEQRGKICFTLAEIKNHYFFNLCHVLAYHRTIFAPLKM